MGGVVPSGTRSQNVGATLNSVVPSSALRTKVVITAAKLEADVNNATSKQTVSSAVGVAAIRTDSQNMAISKTSSASTKVTTSATERVDSETVSSSAVITTSASGDTACGRKSKSQNPTTDTNCALREICGETHITSVDIMVPGYSSFKSEHPHSKPTSQTHGAIAVDSESQEKGSQSAHSSIPPATSSTSESTPHHRDQELYTTNAADKTKQPLVSNGQDSISTTAEPHQPHLKPQTERQAKDATNNVTTSSKAADVVASENKFAATYCGPGTIKDTRTSVSDPLVHDEPFNSHNSDADAASSSIERDSAAVNGVTVYSKEGGSTSGDDSNMADSQTISERKTSSSKSSELSNPKNSSPSSQNDDSDSSTNSNPEDPAAPKGFYTIKVKDFVFTVLKRYQDLHCIGSGAQGIVW